MTDRSAGDEGITVPVFEEGLELSTRPVEAERLRLRKEVHEEPVAIEECLGADVIETRRVPVGQVLDGPVAVRHEGDVTIVPVVRERLVTRKERVLVEEIHIRRRTELRTQREQVNLRRESVRVERFDPRTQQWLPAREADSDGGRQMHTVISTFDDRAAADRAVDRLAEAGFDRGDIHVEDSATAGRYLHDGAGHHEHHGRLSHFFAMLFGSGDRSGDSDLYSEAVRRGSSVVVFDAEDESQADRASALMKQLGAYDIGERADQWRASGWSPETGTSLDEGRASEAPDRATAASEAPARDTAFSADTRGTEGLAPDGKMNVVQEELQVGKREVQKGGVRIVQRVSQKPVREIVRLREEVANVERHAVDRPASPAELDTFREGTVEVREMAEEPVVSKTARVVEEVSVGKQVREREQTIEDTVRRKDVDVQRLDQMPARPAVNREQRASAASQRERRASEDLDRDLSDKDKPR